jgi:hypothetical protein
VNPKDILSELRRLVDRLEIEVTPLLPDSGFKSAYDPINTYLDQLQKGTKPETAAEGLFRSLAEIFLDAPALPQVGLGSGFVDFKLDAKEESSIVIELKPLFHSFSAELLKSFPLEPTDHHSQVQRYLQHSEYLILTDMRDAYLYSARDVWQVLKPFKKLPLHLRRWRLQSRAGRNHPPIPRTLGEVVLICPSCDFLAYSGHGDSCLGKSVDAGNQASRGGNQIWQGQSNPCGRSDGKSPTRIA